MSEYTPGPWTVDLATRRAQYSINSGPVRVALVNGGAGGETGAANAQLIAAAPDMLAALEGLFEHCSMIHSRWGDGCNRKEADQAIKAAREVMARAKGAQL